MQFVTLLVFYHYLNFILMKQARTLVALLLCAGILFAFKPASTATANNNTVSTAFKHTDVRLRHALGLMNPAVSVAKQAPRVLSTIEVLVDNKWWSGLTINSIKIGSTTIYNPINGFNTFNVSDEGGLYSNVTINVTVGTPEPFDAIPTLYVNDWTDLPCQAFLTSGTYVVSGVTLPVRYPFIILTFETGGC
jgi:hypothetical protein